MNYCSKISFPTLCVPKCPTMRSLLRFFAFVLFTFIMGALVAALEILRLGTEETHTWNATFVDYNSHDGTALIHMQYHNSIDKMSIVFYAFSIVSIILFISDSIVESRFDEYREELENEKKVKSQNPLTENLLNKV